MKVKEKKIVKSNNKKYALSKKKKNKFKLNIDPRNILVPIVSILILIVSSLTLGFKLGLIIFLLINLIYFIPIIFKSKFRKKKITYTKKDGRKVTYTKKVNKKKKGKVSGVKKGLKFLLLLALIMFIFGVIAIIGFFAYIVINAPNFDESKMYVSDPTIVLDKNGKEIAKLGTEKRITITYDDLSEGLIDAILATEDSRFFEHKGVDWARFMKASFYQVLGRDEAGGASTLTMQLSKNNYTSTEASGFDGIIRKFTDVYVSMFKIEKKYTKEQIFEFYINSQYLGRHAYGVEQIALNYFGKSTKDLNVAEAALIAGLFQAPGKYDPYNNPEATEARRQTVLKLMLRHGYINKKEYEIAKKLTVEKIVIPKEKNENIKNEISPYQSFIDTVVEEVQDKTGNNPYTTSMIIYTTMDTSIQDYVNNIMNGTSYKWENDKAQGGIAIVNVKDGSISAIGGNRHNDAIDNWNYATDIENQIGSTAKPLYDYGPAIEYNNWSSAQILVDEPITYSNGKTINNWNGKYEGIETMRVALGGSRNIPALKAFKATNKANIIEFVTNLGLNPEIYTCPEGYTRERSKCRNVEDPKVVIDANKDTTLHEAHSIGGYNGESPLTMAAAYAAFANKGVYTEPYSFTKVVYQDSDNVYENVINKKEAMSEETAYIVADMLQYTAPKAMGRYYNINGVKYACKTGTTNYDEAKLKAKGLYGTNAVNDLWTIGFNTEYAIGVWYGYDTLTKQYYNRLSSGQHERLFQAVGKKVFTNKSDFTKPKGVVSVTVEKDCAEPMLPSEFTPNDYKTTELFIKGTEPKNTSQRFAKLKSVSNVRSEVSNGIITVTWDNVEIPKINTEAYLREEYKKVFYDNGYLGKYVNERVSFINNTLGGFGYMVYVTDPYGKQDNGTFVTQNSFSMEIPTSGDYTFVIKTSYRLFKANISDGVSITVGATAYEPIIPDPVDEPEEPIENNG